LTSPKFLGFDRFLAHLAKRQPNQADLLLKAVIAVAGRVRTDMARVWVQITRNTAAIRLGATHAA
jgi:hypothetical protein